MTRSARKYEQVRKNNAGSTAVYARVGKLEYLNSKKVASPG